VSLFTIDVTSRKKAEGRLALLAKVGRMLSASVESHLPSLLTSAVNIVEGTALHSFFCSLFVLNIIIYFRIMNN
jgi:hypothetical protein